MDKFTRSDGQAAVQLVKDADDRPGEVITS